MLRNGLRDIRQLRSRLRGKLFSRRCPRVANIVNEVIANALSYLHRDGLLDLAEAARAIERRGVPGIFIEAGCALGGSAIVLAAAKRKARTFYVYDVFGTIPPPSEKDDEDVHRRYAVIASGKSPGIGGKLYYGYEENLYDKVRHTFEHLGLPVHENNVFLVKGSYQDTMRISSQVALAHIDCDWYESVMTCLKRIEPHLVRGGLLVIDDYYSWSGCTIAVDEYFSARKNDYRFFERFRLDSCPSLHVVKR